MTSDISTDSSFYIPELDLAFRVAYMDKRSSKKYRAKQSMAKRLATYRRRFLTTTHLTDTGPQATDTGTAPQDPFWYAQGEWYVYDAKISMRDNHTSSYIERVLGAITTDSWYNIPTLYEALKGNPYLSKAQLENGLRVFPHARGSKHMALAQVGTEHIDMMSYGTIMLRLIVARAVFYMERILTEGDLKRSHPESIQEILSAVPYNYYLPIPERVPRYPDYHRDLDPAIYGDFEPVATRAREIIYVPPGQPKVGKLTSLAHAIVSIHFIFFDPTSPEAWPKPWSPSFDREHYLECVEYAFGLKGPITNAHIQRYYPHLLAQLGTSLLITYVKTLAHVGIFIYLPPKVITASSLGTRDYKKSLSRLESL